MFFGQGKAIVTRARRHCLESLRMLPRKSPRAEATSSPVLHLGTKYYSPRASRISLRSMLTCWQPKSQEKLHLSSALDSMWRGLSLGDNHLLKRGNRTVGFLYYREYEDSDQVSPFSRWRLNKEVGFAAVGDTLLMLYVI